MLLPPLVTILAQLFMWKVSGLLRVALATPIAAASLVLIKTLHLHDHRMAKFDKLERQGW